MNVIDISHWQSGISLDTIYKQNPTLDGVIIKSTGGVSYKDPKFAEWAKWLTDNGKMWGFYHFLADNGNQATGTAEADYFVNNSKDFFGKGWPFADYEYPATYRGTKFLKEFLDRVLELTGIKCGVYCSLSVVQSQDFSAIEAAGYPLWLAQYPDNNPVYGFLDDPWQRGSYAPFKKYWLHQYTSHGHLNGWNGNLDFDKFYGSAAEWDSFAGKSDTPTELKPADQVVVSAVLNNNYGAGQERVTKLTEAGYDAKSVQDKINELYAIALSCKRYINGNEEYLNSIMKLVRLL